MTLGYAIVVAALAAGVVLLWRLWPAPALEIGERGIRCRALGRSWIPWGDIEGAYPPTLAEAQTVRLRLRRRADPAAEAVEVRVDLAGAEVNAIELLREISTRSPGRTTPA
jgi:hypothetical protein